MQPVECGNIMYLQCCFLIAGICSAFRNIHTHTHTPSDFPHVLHQLFFLFLNWFCLLHILIAETFIYLFIRLFLWFLCKYSCVTLRIWVCRSSPFRLSGSVKVDEEWHNIFRSLSFNDSWVRALPGSLNDIHTKSISHVNFLTVLQSTFLLGPRWRSWAILKQMFLFNFPIIH